MKLTPEQYLAQRGVDSADPAALVLLAQAMGATVTREQVESPAAPPSAPAEPVEWVEIRLPITPAPGSADQAVIATASGPASTAVRDAVLAVLANAMEMAEATEAAAAVSRYLGLPATPS